jgi:hypothetical protein
LTAWRFRDLPIFVRMFEVEAACTAGGPSGASEGCLNLNYYCLGSFTWTLANSHVENSSFGRCCASTLRVSAHTPLPENGSLNGRRTKSSKHQLAK